MPAKGGIFEGTQPYSSFRYLHALPLEEQMFWWFFYLHFHVLSSS